MSFGYPAVLLLLATALPAVAWLVARAERRRRAALAAFGEPAVLARGSWLPRRAALRSGLRLGALGLGILALARPQLGERTGELAHTGRDVLVLLDLSRSMNATDVGGSRLAVARRIGWETISAFPGDRVGLVVFGGSAFLQLPLTSDHAAFKLFLDAASSDDLGDPATDLSAALRTAVKTFEHEGEEGRRAVLVLSDGESGEGDMDAALDEVRLAGLGVFAVGVGTGAGGPMPADSADLPDPYHRDHIGRVIVSRLEEEDLRRAAEVSGGRYARWDQAEELRHLRAGIAAIEPRTLAKREGRQRADRFQWPLAAAVGLLLVEGVLGSAGSAPRRRGAPRGRRAAATLSGAKGAKSGTAPFAALRVTSVILVAGLLGCFGVRAGERHYGRGEYTEAYEIFREALARDSTARLAYNVGNALYRLERYEAAAQSYRASAARAETPDARRRALYNLGNAMVRAAEERPTEAEPLLEAVAAYEGVLQLDPSDADAKWNLEIALRRLDDDRVSGGSSGRGRAADYGQGNMDVPGYEGNPDAAVGAMAGGGFGSAEGESVEELSADQARQLLDAVQRQQLSSHEGRPTQRGPRGERDW
ncbi:MAG TPA: VWA domain-containing protein [Gemmatimonadales bacterium]|nr:VWA domain-containing protein [Gemmatimonadales bacterium]